MSSFTDIFSSFINKGPASVAQGGGKKTIKSKYIKYINKKYNIEELRNICLNRNIKISKRYNGKKVFLKKSSLLKKIADLKYPM